MRTKKTLIIALGIILIAIASSLTLSLRYYADWLWFSHMGYSRVFVTILVTKILTFLAFAFLFAAFAWINITIARRTGKHTRSIILVGPDQPFTTLGTVLRGKGAGILWAAFIIFLALIMGLGTVNAWETILKYLHSTPFGITDPIFSRDVGFYVFKLPFYQFLQSWYAYSVVLVFIMVGVSYYFDQSLTLVVKDNRFQIIPKAQYHLAILGGLFFLGVAWSYRLKLFESLYSTRGVAYGASYTDVHALIPAYWALLALSLVMALGLLLFPLFRRWKPLVFLAVLYCLAFVSLIWIYPTALEQYTVKPNEVTKEAPYIKNNIKFTRLAYGLNEIQEKGFPVQENITYRDIQKNRSTVENIRLWDRRPLIQTYKQLQEIRLYYDFKSVEVDRYHFKKYMQVALAARELPPSQIPARARTWVNIHLKYTHGYGVVMNPVNQVTPEGMPNFIVKDIPPRSLVPLKITRPEIYYGEETDQYAIVKTKTREFDYPKGDENVYTTYRGRGGVEISSIFRRLIYAWYFSDIKILFTDYITPKSRIMYHRIVTDRDRTLAPFLAYDSDPYMVVGDDGALYWIHDAYTKTDMFPYSEPITQFIKGLDLNYIRNSVKVVINAYNGDVDFYVVDSRDPLIQTYRKIFPGLFKPMKEMPPFLKRHFRYPTDMFLIQTHIYNIYHMTDPQVFYNQEDYWNIPTEIYCDTEQPMFPYYIIMKLPQEKSEEFILMLPLTPSKKNNMIAWLCARCDPPNYGKLIVYKLPKEKLVYGPMQIEARINQKPDISSEFTLWGQKGSRVIRGNLLIIPIARSFIYVEPVYLQSEQSQMPELKRVVVAFGDKLEMRKTLDEALRAIFSAQGISPQTTGQALKGIPSAPLPREAQRALYHYNRAMEFLKKGDWAGFGSELQEVKRILERMSRETPGRKAQPSHRARNRPRAVKRGVRRFINTFFPRAGKSPSRFSACLRTLKAVGTARTRVPRPKRAPRGNAPNSTPKTREK